MQIGCGEDYGFAAARLDAMVEFGKARFASFKIVVEIAENCEIPVGSIDACVRVRRVVVALHVANEMRLRVLLQTDAPDLSDQRLDDTVHLLVKLSSDFRFRGKSKHARAPRIHTSRRIESIRRARTDSRFRPPSRPLQLVHDRAARTLIIKLHGEDASRLFSVFNHEENYER